MTREWRFPNGVLVYVCEHGDKKYAFAKWWVSDGAKCMYVSHEAQQSDSDAGVLAGLAASMLLVEPPHGIVTTAPQINDLP